MLWFESNQISTELFSLLGEEIRQDSPKILIIHFAHSRRFVEQSDFRTQVGDATWAPISNLVQGIPHFQVVAERPHTFIDLVQEELETPRRVAALPRPAPVNLELENL